MSEHLLTGDDHRSSKQVHFFDVIEVAPSSTSLCASAGGSSGDNALPKASSLPPARFTEVPGLCKKLRISQWRFIVI
jgi:hypothetical protein